MVSVDDLDGIRELLSILVGPELDEQAPRNAAELELLAVDSIGQFGRPELPEEVLALLPEAPASRRDELAAGVLAAPAELAPPRLATSPPKSAIDSHGTGSGRRSRKQSERCRLVS